MTDSPRTLQETIASVRLVAEEELERYANGAQRPLAGYAVLVSIYSTVLATLASLVHRRGGLPERFGAGDLALLGVATHKMSRLVTKDTVSAIVRAPFTTFAEPTGEGEVHEEVRTDTSFRHAAGELLTCPFCTAVWIATILAFGLVLAPRPTRLVASILTAVASSDFLQLAYAITQRAAHGG
ncbi:MAG: DUF1360 domain-containing protein [Acidimicrobiales bacterium]